jgi:hypothetical protein
MIDSSAHPCLEQTPDNWMNHRLLIVHIMQLLLQAAQGISISLLPGGMPIPVYGEPGTGLE